MSPLSKHTCESPVCLFVCLFACLPLFICMVCASVAWICTTAGGQTSKFKDEHFKDCLQRFTLICIIRILELYITIKEGAIVRELRLRSFFEISKPKSMNNSCSNLAFSFRQTDSGVRNTMLVLRFLHDLEHHLDAMNSQKIGCLGNLQNDGMGSFWGIGDVLEI